MSLQLLLLLPLPKLTRELPLVNTLSFSLPHARTLSALQLEKGSLKLVLGGVTTVAVLATRSTSVGISLLCFSMFAR